MTSTPGSKYFRRLIHDFDVLRLLVRLLSLHPDATVHLCYNKPFSNEFTAAAVLSGQPLDEFRAAVPRLVVHEDEELQTEWPGMAHADILVGARSSYSILPSLFNDKQVWFPLSEQDAASFMTPGHDGKLDPANTLAYYAATSPQFQVRCSFISEIVKAKNASSCRDLFKADLRKPMHTKPIWT